MVKEAGFGNTQPYPQLGEPAPALNQRVVLVTMREQQALPVDVDHVLVGSAVHRARYQVVIAVDVAVAIALEATRNLRV